MRRIILALSLLALTGCDEPRADSAAVVPGGPGQDEAARTAAPDARRPSAGAQSSAPGARAEVPGTPVTPDANGAVPRSDAGTRGATRTIVIVGTSLTAGYGVGADFAYPAVLQQMIDSVGLPFRIVNAGISGETSAGGLRRIDWSLQQPTDVLVLELGANDALRGLDPAHMRSNLDAILSRARELHPDIALVLIGMEAPPNLGSAYTRRFRDVYTDLARRHDAALVPFLLEGVAGEPSLNIDDGIHPNVEGHRLLAGTVWETIEGVLVALAR